MKTFSILAIALGVALCAPTAVYANDSAMRVDKHQGYHRVASATILNKAEALAPAPVHVPETDGLSRDRDDCNYGCIDNGE